MKSAIATDADYLAAVKAGDMDEVQRMVDDAAKAAGYNVGPVYHGVRDRYRMGTESSPPAILPATKFNKWVASEANYPAFYASRDRSAVERWAKRPSNVMSVYLKAQNTAKEGDRVISSSFIQKEVVDKLKSLGYDSVEGGRDFYAHEIAVFDPSQIKSADPITYDKSGQVIPLSKRFNSSSEEITNPIVPTGDTKKSQRMVDAAAKKAGYTFGPFHHGSGWSSHNVFERGKSPSGRLKPYPNYGLDDIGFWFTSSKNQANEYGTVLQMEGEKRPPTRLYNVFLNIKNSLEFADHQEFNEWINSYAKNYAVDEKSKALMKEGRSLLGSLNVNMLLERLKMGKKDGIIIWKGNGDQRFGLKPNESYPTWAIVFEPTQIKLADSVTYDKSGKMIPLSKRFDSSRSEITNPAGRIPAQFPFEYASYLKQHFPEIWKLGGNIRGNDAFRWWSAYRQGDRSPTVTHWWSVTRPAWIARHYRDHRIAGVVAQIKWGAIGTLGVTGMKRVIESKIRDAR